MGDQAPGGGAPLAPLPLAKRIIGYCDPLSAAPGEQVRFFVSCEPGISSVRADLVRLRAGPPGRETAGPECDPVPGDCAGTYAAQHQDIHPGSYALIAGGGQALRDGPVSLVLLVQPTYRAAAPQVLVSAGDPWTGPGVALILDEQLRPALIAGPGSEAVLTGPAALETGAWSVVTATFGGDAPGRLMAGPLAGGGEPWPMVTGPVPVARADPAGAGHGADGTGHPPGVAGPGPGPGAQNLVLGAVMSAAGTTRMHFTGRLESPMIMDGALGPAQARALMTAGPAGAGSVRAAWDFSIGISTWAVTDRGPHGLHGTLYNLPMRAVRGARWTGRHNDWREAPGEYAALHFLADALEDCGWAETFTWAIPDGTPSGFYAARVSSGPHQDFIPLFVRPAAPAARVLLIAPTATYAAYGNSRFWWENPIQEMVQDRLVEIGAEEQYLIVHPELGASSYDCHLDGTDVCYVSRRRPNLNMRPGHVRREGYTSDLDLVAWLDQLDLPYDVVTDEDVHCGGGELLRPYPVVITGTHPEYMSAVMFDAIADWAGAGGRLAYLGGNGFSMNVSFGAERPWITENRRVDLWERDEKFQRSEAVQATDGRRGGYLSASGRQAATVTGVESATMGFDHSYPYVLTEAARRPEAAFVFAGVTGDVIGDFGAIGGGVVGQEWDNAAGHDLGPGHLILGSSHDHTLVPPLFGAVRPDYHADLVLYLRGAGAAFSVSSMAWCAALSHNGYANDVARITHNVLRRFLDPAPFPPAGAA